MSLSFTTSNWLKRFCRQGPYFKMLYKELTTSHTGSREALKKYRTIRLQRMVRYCYENVPYYSDLFRRLSLRPEDIRDIADLEKIPLLDKETVKENFDKLIAKNYPKVLCKTAYTSGTTGMPSKFIRDYNSINLESAIVWRHWKQSGDPGKRRLTLRGDLIVPQHQEGPPFWKYNSANRELLMSSYHLSIENSKTYLDEILKFQPAILYAFPSTAHLLAKFFRTHQINYTFDGVFTSSECVEPFMKEYVEETFQTKIYDWYGQAERVAALGQCRYDTYHVQEDYSLVEFVDTENGCEIVGSHLHNFAMPLLRYQTNDFVVLSNTDCPCGHHSRTVEKIVGRSPGVLITPEGYRIMSAPAYVFKEIESIFEAQFYQERPGEVVIKVVTKNGLTIPDKDAIIKNTLLYTSPHMRVTIEEVPFIEKGANGKFVNIVNKCASLEAV